MLEQDQSAAHEPENISTAATTGSEPCDSTLSQEPSVTDQTEERLTSLEKELEDNKAESKKYHNDYLRVRAEMDNLRKRTLKEKEDLARYGQEGFFKDLLPVMDSLQQAGLSSASAEEIVEGMKLVQKQMWDVFEKHGLQAIEAEGKAFDPELHQAIAREESDDVTEELVQMEFARGYQLHDRLLRASMVRVVVPKSE
ncbi:MAG: nucleotide exchange factor GrpE [Oligoflexales bacterium]